jgi:hypothetical protein
MGLGVASLVLVAAPAGAGTAPKVKVSPSAALPKKATVMVTGRNLGENQTIRILECAASDTTGTGCNSAGAVHALTSEVGRLHKTALPVSVKFTDEGGTVIKCSAESPCVVSASNATTGTHLDSAPISFK